jgi:hypothetical protein
MLLALTNKANISKKAWKVKILTVFLADGDSFLAIRYNAAP